jgi:hypothetical protein
MLRLRMARISRSGFGVTCEKTSTAPPLAQVLVTLRQGSGHASGDTLDLYGLGLIADWQICIHLISVTTIT